jgi:hypothetical protein
LEVGGPAPDPAVDTVEAVGVVEPQNPQHGDFDAYPQPCPTIEILELYIPTGLPGVSGIPEEQPVGAGGELEAVFRGEDEEVTAS